MNTVNVSAAPAADTGAYISYLLQNHSDKKILLLLSGGSSISVLKHIDTSLFGQHTTVMMADDRFTTSKEDNNHLQLTNTDFYLEIKKAGAHIISSTPKKTESHEAFTNRINEELTTSITKHKDVHVIGLFGIGNDGHTASILPSNKSLFEKRYNKAERFYVQVEEQTNDHPKRATVTPAFIKDHIDEIVVFAQGKQEILLSAKVLTEAYDFPALLVLKHSQSTLFTNAEIAHI